MDVVQPVSFAVMVALAEVWRGVGVVPDGVVGHSQGEIAAAYVAGVLSLEDAARIVVHRSRLIATELAGHGGMVAVAAAESEVCERLGRFGGRIGVAAVNGPMSVVVSGEPEALDGLMAECERDGVRVRRVAVDYASHGPQVERLRGGLLGVLEGVRPGVGRVPVFSTVVGRWVDGVEMDAGYWFRNLREPVGFGSAVAGLVGEGFSSFVEVSAHPVLVGAVEGVVEEAG
ncbi:acyltransferase domain-containing protein, partial [Nocardiopsis mangrovi]